MVHIKTLNADQAAVYLSALIALLQDAVDSGASVGFLPPLSADDAKSYWLDMINDVRQNTRILLTAHDPDTDQLIGAVQLALATKFNGLHRAEVQKLFVLREARSRGIGHQLMAALEQVALAHARSLLVLDTRHGDTAEQLYRKIGYIEAGVIPQYARSANGELHATIFFYKQLDAVKSK